MLPTEAASPFGSPELPEVNLSATASSGHTRPGPAAPFGRLGLRQPVSSVIGRTAVSDRPATAGRPSVNSSASS